MGGPQTLEIKENNYLVPNISHLKEIAIICGLRLHFGDMLKHWKGTEFWPLSFNVIAPVLYSDIECLVECTTQLSD